MFGCSFCKFICKLFAAAYTGASKNLRILLRALYRMVILVCRSLAEVHSVEVQAAVVLAEGAEAENLLLLHQRHP